ncbi:MAG: DUF3316 domain-containing protein [Prevotellaceae bacterium]|nr:DUF3316 domain-containing protein [Prevotellaceae bacterium]
MRLRLSIILILSLACLSGYAQSERTTLFGFGRANQYDTYLSPLEYAGPQFSLSNRTVRDLARQPHVSFETLTQIEYSYTKNATGSAHEHGGAARFDTGWSYNWRNLAPGLSLSAGGLVGADFGFLYNTRNSNNPAQARVGARLSATVEGTYRLRIKKRHLTLDYKATMPLLGCMFSPQYGQSYYNIFSQGNYDHNILATHPGNALSLRQRLTVSIPVKKQAVTVGYASDLLQSKPHSLRQHQYSRYLLVGWSFDKPRKKNE